ncbi:MAG: ferritin-like domain-containing protein [Chloroflexota bacterium]|nr:ferritin-like domain-containing protein [Chloroflexota bacterium]
MIIKKAPSFKSDLEVMNYALTLEHLEDNFYRTVNASGRLQGNAAKYLTVIGAHEKAHVDALTASVRQAGGTPVAELSKYNFAALGDIGTSAGILAVASVLEATGVKAYNGAAREITSKQVLTVAGAIVQVEARHVAIIRALIDPNASPVPKSFEDKATPQEIMDAIKPIIS